MSNIKIIHWLVLFGAVFHWSGPRIIAAKGKQGDNNLAHEIHVTAIEKTITLDGVLSENEWEDAAVIYTFTQKEPNEGALVSEPTFVLISYDQHNIYFGIRCFDSMPQLIVANEMRRDYDLSENDFFEIIIDTYHDQRNAFYFATNSLGARLDSEIKADGAYINRDWDGVWSSVAKKDDQGWTAEVAIPFKTLRFDNKDNLTWGINFARYIPRKHESSYWAPISRNDDFDDNGKFKPSKFGKLLGLQNIKQNSRIQLKPLAIGGFERDYGAGNVNKTRLSEIGLDAKLHLTSNITSDLTINPDFAQVESDAEQVNLSRFSLFFPEKREFFMESADVFTIGEGSTENPFSLLFFSRNIGLNPVDNTGIPILGGAKIISKEGPYELGLINVYTNKSDHSNIPETNYAAFRIKRDIFARSSIGFMALSKDLRHDKHYNRTFAIDADFAFDSNLSISGYIAKTQTPGSVGKDYNSYVKTSWGSDKYYAFGSFTDIGSNFNPEMGFLQWRDIRKYNLFMSYSPRPKTLNTRQTHFQNNLEYITDHKNTLQFRTISPGIFNVFNDESTFFIGLTNYYDNAPGFFLGRPEQPAFVEPGIYKYNVLGVSYASDQSKNLSGSLRLGGGSFYDGSFKGMTLSSAWRPNNKFGIDVSWQWNKMDIPVANGKFDGNLIRAKLKYSFTTRLFINADFQWNELYNRFSNKLLLNYIHTPGSDFYLVYSDLWDTRAALQTTNRALIAKFTYLLNL